MVRMILLYTEFPEYPTFGAITVANESFVF